MAESETEVAATTKNTMQTQFCCAQLTAHSLLAHQDRKIKSVG